MERKVTEVESFTTISSDDYVLEIRILIPEYSIAVAELALSIEVFVYLDVFFRKPDSMILSNDRVKRESLVMCLTRAYQRRWKSLMQ